MRGAHWWSVREQVQGCGLLPGVTHSSRALQDPFMRAEERPNDTRDKALAVNLDPRRYGTFAEIGAGQEVVRWFFRAGGAAGTIAKSISAYDMTVSDAIYGRGDRYVCRERMQSMLDYEQRLSLERLKERRGDQTAFFTFADTVATRSYTDNNECHGWMGIKFQAHPRDEDSQVLLHVRMLDAEAAAQQEALGVVGVNLVHAAHFLSHEPDQIVEALLDNLTTDRIEIDIIEFSGIEFRHVDNRVMSLRLVQLGLTGAAMFSAKGAVLQPSEVLRKRPVLVERGSFRPVTHVNVNMLDCALERFSKEPDIANLEPLPLMELTMSNLLAEGELDLSDFLARADVLAATGCTVLISDYVLFYQLAAYLRRHTSERIALTMGASSLRQLFDVRYYEALEGGVLESFGRLFKSDLKLYIYPFRDPLTNELSMVENIVFEEPICHLYRYLVECGVIEQLEDYREEYLSIFSRDVLCAIREGQPGWEDCVPAAVADVIRRRGFFGAERSLSG